MNLSPNSKFASVEAIQRAQIEAGDVEDSLSEEEQQSDGSSDSTAEGSCIVAAVRE